METFVGIAGFLLFVWAIPKLWGRLYWAITPPHQITPLNINYVVGRYGPPPASWVAKNGTPWIQEGEGTPVPRS